MAEQRDGAHLAPQAPGGHNTCQSKGPWNKRAWSATPVVPQRSAERVSTLQSGHPRASVLRRPSQCKRQTAGHSSTRSLVCSSDTKPHGQTRSNTLAGGKTILKHV